MCTSEWFCLSVCLEDNSQACNAEANFLNTKGAENNAWCQTQGSNLQL